MLVRGRRLFEGVLNRGRYLYKEGTYWGHRLFEGQPLIEGGAYWGGSVYLRASRIWGQRLFGGGSAYSGAVLIGVGRLLRSVLI